MTTESSPWLLDADAATRQLAIFTCMNQYGILSARVDYAVFVPPTDGNVCHGHFAMPQIHPEQINAAEITTAEGALLSTAMKKLCADLFSKLHPEDLECDGSLTFDAHHARLKLTHRRHKIQQAETLAPEFFSIANIPDERESTHVNSILDGLKKEHASSIYLEYVGPEYRTARFIFESLNAQETMQIVQDEERMTMLSNGAHHLMEGALKSVLNGNPITEDMRGVLVFHVKSGTCEHHAVRLQITKEPFEHIFACQAPNIIHRGSDRPQ